MKIKGKTFKVIIKANSSKNDIAGFDSIKKPIKLILRLRLKIIRLTWN